MANEVAAEYGYWLDDAFASEAKPAMTIKQWASPHVAGSPSDVFPRPGYQYSDSAVLSMGIGDMSGDVFGNGLLLSRHVRLVGL